ncbi:MAG TPA: AraC family transcriptional regulator ligand-binding domain-containing protein, partial [Burkholderiaceae bacterium]|nr:AraC family transcriptional regulator ligand-binding domain-containing protein [Burkholderiaceae bacterium]
MFRPVKFRHYLALMQHHGHASADVLAGTGLREAMLSDPDCLIDVSQAKTILARMIALTGDQGLGLEAGRQTELLDLGLVGHAIMSAPSAREAVHYWMNYSNTLVGTLIQMRLEEHGPNDWSLLISETVPLGFVYNFCTEETLVMAYRLAGVLTGTPAHMTGLELSYPAPAHQALYAQHFDGPIRFNAPQTRIRFNRPSLDLPIRGNDQAFNALCARQCELMLRRIGEQSPCATQVRNVLMRLRGQTPTIDTVARALALSPRHLRRQLHSEGHSFQHVLSDFRQAMVKEYLSATDMTP